MDSDQLLELATEKHRAGQLSEAKQLYQKVLEQSPANPVAMIRSGVLELQEERAENALPLVEKALLAAPGNARYEFVHGQVLSALCRWKEAETAYRRSLEIEPLAADVQFALGLALQSGGELERAITAYDAATKIQADFADAFNNIGNCHQLLGDLGHAESAYRRALEIKSDYASAMSNLGTVLKSTGRINEAVSLLRTACCLEPNVTRHLINLAAALCQRRNFSEAARLLGPAVERDPNNAQAAFNLGNALQHLGQLREAAEQYRRAIALDANYTDALINLGNVYKELGEFKLASATYESAITSDPGSVVALNNLGCLHRTLGRFEEAEAIFRRGIALNPFHASLRNNFSNVLKDIGALDEAVHGFRRAIELDPTDPASHSNLVYALSFSATDGNDILDECLKWNQLHAMPLHPEICAHTIDRSPDRRLKIGYVSPDFRDHCQSLFTIPLLSHHDRSNFEITCYSSVERPDEFTRRISGYSDRSREVRPLDDAALYDLIRADQIDILVDLTMHMANGRPLVFARRPAPIQIAWLAYPGTTGMSAMDYRLSDPRLDPPGTDHQYSERTIRLPDSFWCYDPFTTEPEVSPLPALANGYITFGCLNNPCKLTDQTLRLWGRVMRAVPTARLLVMAPPGSHRLRMLKRLANVSIDADRITFLPHHPRAAYLNSYHQIDLGLDTFPYNGHTTSLDSLWMGVPVVTRVGQTCVGRAGLSQLFQLDMLELAAKTDEEFAEVATRLANDLSRLVDLRKQLRSRIEKSPLMNAERFARNMEAIYRRVFHDYCHNSLR